MLIAYTNYGTIGLLLFTIICVDYKKKKKTNYNIQTLIISFSVIFIKIILGIMLVLKMGHKRLVHF